jgi:hypothetical protein
LFNRHLGIGQYVRPIASSLLIWLNGPKVDP